MRVLVSVVASMIILIGIMGAQDSYANQSITLEKAFFNQNSGKFGAVVSISGYAQDDLDNFNITFGLWNSVLKEGDVDGEDFDKHGNFHQKSSKFNSRSQPFVELQNAKINLNTEKVSFKATSFDITPSQLEDFLIIIGIHNPSARETTIGVFPFN